MKVLLVNKFHYRKGGSETYYFELAEGLRKAGHEVVFFAMEGPDNEPCEQSRYFVSAKDYNGPTSVKDKFDAATSLIYSTEAKEKFEQLLQAERPDVIHLNLTHRQITFSILDAPSAKDIPVVYTAHDYVPVCPNAIMLDNAGNICEECLKGSFMPCLKKKCVKHSTAKSALAVMEAEFLKRTKMYRRIDKVIAPSECMRRKLIRGGFLPDQVVMMRNFTTQDLIERAENLDVDAPREHTFLFFGRLSPEKGADIAVGAFAAAMDALPADWKLLIAGDGPERERIEQIIDEYDLSERVKMLGFLAKDEMQELVRKASVAMTTSRCQDNMPYSVVEAFAAGTPVIGSRIGGIPELVQDGKTGILCEPDDVASTAFAMLAAAEMGQSELAQMRQSCCEYVLDNCRIDDYVERIVELYGQLKH